MTFITELFTRNQELLWFATIAADLGFAILLFRLFGRQGLYASIIISLLLANLQGQYCFYEIYQGGFTCTVTGGFR